MSLAQKVIARAIDAALIAIDRTKTRKSAPNSPLLRSLGVE
jgi:hypothetical protein|tara:strand:+ start:330 stop:452 length:123 start_codon:yes stop_codon:yes gene_type:complete